MGNPRWSQLLAVVAGLAISLAPISAGAQGQPAAAQDQAKPVGPLANARELCSKESGRARSSKEKLTGLPANVIEPKKTPEGWPDLQGTWNSGAYTGSAEHSLEIGTDPIDIAVQCQSLEKLNVAGQNMLIDPMRGRIPYQPWAKAHQMELLAGIYAPGRRMDVDPEVLCFPVGVPHSMMRGGGGGTIELRYVPGAVVVLFNKTTRIIPMDNVPHLSDNIKLYMGDSRAHFEGSTLVIETSNNRENTWFDKHATFHSQESRVIERMTMVSEGTLYYEATIIDPTVFTQPWKIAQTFDRQMRPTRILDVEGHEDTCHESDTSVERTVRAGLRARAVGIRGYHIHVDLATGKPMDPADQKYLDESGQPLGYSFAPVVPDSALPKGFSYMYTPPAATTDSKGDSKAKDGSAPH